ncbi:MAG: FMN-dependent NADH-azoreductase [Rubrimonas sp.]
MAIILHVDASARTTRSLTRDLSASLVAQLCERIGEAVVLRRDLASDPPPFVTEAWIKAAFTKAEGRTTEDQSALAWSDTAIAELERADIIVLGAPMYNYGLPAALKAWIDQVVRVDRTFSFDLARGDWPLAPILGGKALALLTASGEFGFGPGGIRETWNHLDNHLRALSSYLGVAHFHHIGIEYQEFGDARHACSVAEAKAALPALADRLASGLETLT